MVILKVRILVILVERCFSLLLFLDEMISESGRKIFFRFRCLLVFDFLRLYVGSWFRRHLTENDEESKAWCFPRLFGHHMVVCERLEK